MPGMVVPGQQTNGDACRFITEDNRPASGSKFHARQTIVPL